MAEIDRGTMPVARGDITQTSFERKMRAYLTAHAEKRHERQFGWRTFRVLTVTTDDHRKRSMMPEQPRRLVVLFRNPRRATSERPACPSLAGWKWYRVRIELDMVHLRPHFCANRLWAITASARCGTCSASPLPSRRQIKGHNCSPSITVTELSRTSRMLTSLCGCICFKYFPASTAVFFRSRYVRHLPSTLISNKPPSLPSLLSRP
jgi:hypothetical protein